jgi:D-sedoheptulose 7-phosphate isomerase
VTFAYQYLREVQDIAGEIQHDELENLVDELERMRELDGRLFIVGLGGSAANSSHAANDFRKLAGINAVCLSDNVSELTARANDDGWAAIYRDSLIASDAKHPDALLVLSVGGGTTDVSTPLVAAIEHAMDSRMKVLGIVGRDGGHTKKRGHAVVVIPTVEASRVTPHTEAFQLVVLHYLVSHPRIQLEKTKW